LVVGQILIEFGVSILSLLACILMTVCAMICIALDAPTFKKPFPDLAYGAADPIS
jgi:hypothetical protein